MMPRPDIDKLAAEVHVLNRTWWPEDINQRNKGEMLMLVISEYAEAMEGERRDLMDDKLPHRKMAEVECGDAMIRVLDIMGAFQYKYLPTYKTEFAIPTNNKGEILYNLCGIVCCADLFPSVHHWLTALINSTELYCQQFGYDLWAAVYEKLEYNKTRADHQVENRKLAGGKKW